MQKKILYICLSAVAVFVAIYMLLGHKKKYYCISSRGGMNDGITKG